MFYIYPTDGGERTHGTHVAPDALDPGYAVGDDYKKRQKSLFYNVVDRILNEPWFPDTAEEMAKQYPRPVGLRCDAKSITKMSVGDDPRLIPFGTLPYGWSPMLDTNTYESPGMSAGFDPEPPARSKELKELSPLDMQRELAAIKEELAERNL